MAFQILPWRFDKTTSLKIQELRMVASSGLSIGVNWVGTDELPGFKFWSKLCAFLASYLTSLCLILFMGEMEAIIMKLFLRGYCMKWVNFL